MTTTRLVGMAAIEAAGRMGLQLAKYQDPVEGARDGLTVAEAREVAAVDASLIYLDVPVGTTVENVTTEQIESLMRKAGEAGDTAQVELCERARHQVGGGWTEANRSRGGNEAVALCVRAIRAAEAMS